MKKLIFILLLPLYVYSQDYTSFLPEVAWRTVVDSVVYQSDNTYTVKVNPIDVNDPGALNKVIGTFLTDNKGRAYEITDSLTLSTGNRVITVVDVYRSGAAPFSGAIGYVTKATGNGNSRGLSVNYFEELDNKAIDYKRRIDNRILWEHGQTIPFDSMRLDTNYVSSGTEPTATVYWDDDNQTISFPVPDGGVIQIGQEPHDYYHNLEGAAIVNGDIVSTCGASGNRTSVCLTDATDDVKSLAAFGMVTVPTIGNNNVGRITKSGGKVRGLNTIAYAEGTKLYVDPLNKGKWTATMPAAPNRAIKIGTVAVSHAVNGVVELQIQVLPTASEIAFVPTGSVSSTNVQTAIEELDTEKAPASGSANYIQNQTSSTQTADFKINGNGTANRFISTIITGTAPFTVASTTVNTNLNADLLDGQHGSYYQPLLTNPVTGTGTANYIPKWGVGGTSLTGTSLIYDNGTNVLIGTTLDNSSGKLQINGGSVFGTTTKAYIRDVGTSISINRNPSNGIISNSSLSSLNLAVTANYSVIANYTTTGASTLSQIYMFNSGNTGIGTSALDNGVDRLQVNGSISGTTAKFTNLTDNYIPKHTSDAVGLENSNVYQSSNILLYNSANAFSTDREIPDVGWVKSGVMAGKTSTTASTALTNTDYTVICQTGVTKLLFPASPSTGKVFVLVNHTGSAISLRNSGDTGDVSYTNYSAATVTTLAANSAIRIQYIGTTWYLIE